MRSGTADTAPVFEGGGAIDAQVLHPALIGAPAAPGEVGLQQVQQLGHGGEEEHAVARRMELYQHAVQHLELAAAPHEHRSVVVIRRWVAQARVIAYLHACVNRGTVSMPPAAALHLEGGPLSDIERYMRSNNHLAW